jgi:23S rRNA maturation-related 3'-5' exoribonuclease YhaM
MSGQSHRQTSQEPTDAVFPLTSSRKECYSMKLDLLTNAIVVDDAIRFVTEKSNNKDREQVRSSASTSSDTDNEDDKESNEPDYSVEVRIQLGNIVINW